MTDGAPEQALETADPPARPWVRWLGLGLGAAVFLFFALVPTELHHIPGFGKRPAYAAATASLMAVLWLFEAIPIAATACLPLLFYPLFGVFGEGPLGDTKKAALPFTDAYIFLFLGGMILGGAMEEQNLHRRVALHILRSIGTRPRRLLLGMLLATALVSLWISNTATAVMMVPIAVALLRELEIGEKRKLRSFGCALLLAVAYASNVGGAGSKIGTATNSIFLGFAADKMKVDIGFLQYLLFGLPFVLLFLPIVWGVLWVLGRRDHIKGDRGRAMIDRELAEMGRMKAGERRVAIVFFTAAALWIGSDVFKPLVTPLLSIILHKKAAGKHYEAAVALIAGGTLLAARSIGWNTLKRIPWGTLLLLGGSFAMAAGIESSGLGKWMAARFEQVGQMPFLAQVGLTSFGTVALSAVASNTATMNIALSVLPRSLPVLGASALAASCDFMLPAGTPPNAIVFGSGAIRLPVMMRVGFVLDLCAALTITIYVVLYGRFIL